MAGRDELVDRFIAAIEAELDLLKRPAIETLFIGGGTPTHLDPPALDRFLTMTKRRFDCESLCEFSVEANPEDIDETKLDLLASHGVNRISLGVQSFQASKLSLLQRGHSDRIATAAVEACATKIGNVSIDLIFAAPGETLSQWQADLRHALSLPIDHLSTYALTFEKGTPFWNQLRRGELNSLDDDVEVEMYQTARSMCRDRGLHQYEISSFAKPGKQCQHNLAYWRGRGWYAAGPGAASFTGGVRRVNHRSTTTYLKKIESGVTPVQESESILPEQYARERFAFGMRMIEGVDVDQLSAETGIDLQELCRDELLRMKRDELIAVDGPRLHLTERGILFADTVASNLLSD